MAARRQWITPRQHLLLTGRHSAQHVGTHGLWVQWRYDDGRMLELELNLGPEALQAEPQHIGPVEAQLVFAHHRPDDAPRGTWPPYSARWTLGEEITL